MKRAVFVRAVALCLPFALSACAYWHGEHNTALDKSQSVVVDFKIEKVTPEFSLQKATEICNGFGKKPLLSSSTPPGNPPLLQADFYRCV